MTTDAPGALGRTPLLNVIEPSTHARRFTAGTGCGFVALRAVHPLESGAEQCEPSTDGLPATGSGQRLRQAQDRPGQAQDAAWRTTSVIRYLVRRLAGWLLMIFVATNVTYFLANFYLHPRSNYVGRQPPVPEATVDGLLNQYNLNDKVGVVERWWTWITGILTRWDWGFSPVGESVNEQIAFRIWVSAQLGLLRRDLATVIGIALGVLHGLAAVQARRPVRAGHLDRHAEHPARRSPGSPWCCWRSRSTSRSAERSSTWPAPRTTTSAASADRGRPDPAPDAADHRRWCSSATPETTSCSGRCCWTTSTPTTCGRRAPRD